MRDGIDAATLALYLSGDYDTHYRFKVANGSGTMINLQARVTDLNLNLPNPDAPIASLQIDLIREKKIDGTDSLSPLMYGSLLNRLDDGTTYSPQLEIARPVSLESALTAPKAARPADNASIWYPVFDGNIDRIGWAKYARPASASIKCTDRCGLLTDIKSEVSYTYTIGTPVETAIRQVLDNNGCTWMPLYVPVPTGKVLVANYAPGLQKPVWDQVWDLAQSMGWLIWLRYKADKTFALTLFRPPREKTISDLTIPKLDDFSAFDVSKEQLRNVGWAQVSLATGQRVNVGPVEDPASISRFNNIRRPFWINFEPDSPVRSYNDAQDVLLDAVADVATPDVVATALAPEMPFVECSVDLYTFPSDLTHYDQDQQFAPYSATLSVSAGVKPSTSINLGGKPSAGYRTWRTMMAAEHLEIIGVTTTLDSDNLLRLTANLPPNTFVRWRAWSRLGASPLTTEGDPDPTYLKGPSTEGTETNQIRWAVQDGTHHIVVRAYASSGSFFQYETTHVVTGVGSGAGSTSTTGSGGGSSGAGAPDTTPGIPFILPTGVVVGGNKQVSGGWVNTGSSNLWHVEAEWTSSSAVVVDTLAPSTDVVGESLRSFAVGNEVSLRVRYVNKIVTPNVPGNWSLASNSLTIA